MTIKIQEQKINETLEKNYMPYAMSVIVSRALPEIDGFKPSHRKLLYTMYKMGLLKGSRTKSANVVGQTMKLNPHGDMAIYDTLVRLTRGNEALLHPYIDSKGNFGRYYSRDMHYAAPRYTEVKLDAICREVFSDIEKNSVEFVDNYDGTMKEPLLFPVTFPSVLVNSNQGIAVGMASNICSFNMLEVCEAACHFIKDENTEIENYLKAPDFSSGGKLIYNKDEISQIYQTGRGSFKLRAVYGFDKAGSCIEIREIPYTTTSEAIMDAIIDLVKKGKMKEITDVRDETDLKGLKITIDIRKSADPDEIMKKLYRLTPLQDTFSCNFNILIKGHPVVMSIKSILKEWTNFRIECIKRQTLFDMEKNSERLHLLQGLEKILLDIDRAIAIIRETKRDQDVIPNLMEGFSVDSIQAEFVADIRLRNLNREYILKMVKETDSLKKEVKRLKDIYVSNDKIKNIIIGQLETVAKEFGHPRKTEIIYEENVEEITKEQLIEDYNVRIFFTQHNYIKKIPLISLRTASEQKLKDNDRIIQELEGRNKSDLLLFSDRVNVYKLKAYELEDSKASSLGEYLPNILSLDEGENIVFMSVTDDYSGFLLFLFENGKSAKIALKSYETKTNRKKLTNAYFEGSRLVDARHLITDQELVAFSSIDKVLVFDTSAISLKTTRSSQGVTVMKSKKGSFLAKIKALDEAGLKDPEYYRTKNIPAVGCFIKDEDSGALQMDLFNG